MKILIVDDEIPAVESILRCIDWKQLGFRSVYTANSLEEAKKLLLRCKVDILLTDIELHDKRGFDLIRWCNENHYNCTSIILSGFADFEYARTAIKLGVLEYLLKPVDDATLKHALQMGIERVKQRQRLAEEKPTEAPGDDVIERVEAYILEHISERINRNDIAAHVGLSPEYLSTYFKRETNSTLSDYIRIERIGFAKYLLRQTNLPISIISENTGYESISYFSAVFRQTEGCTPREYRKKCKE